MATHAPEPSEDDLRAPAPLVKALRDLHRERVLVPGQVDSAILAAAARNLAKGRGRSWQWLSAAAALVVAGWLAWMQLGTQIAREDVNRDGRVDILDAFVLSRRISSGGVQGIQWDLNRDGVIDKRDVDLIAKRAVRLAKGGAL
jgi:hypothetical protein